jgi:hypothetical protein
MVHAEALTGPAGIVLDAAAPLEPFTEWAAAAKSGGGAVWMQIDHPGRQIQANMPGVVWGPSAVGVDLGRHSSRADFRRGGFDADDARQVIAMLEPFGVDWWNCPAAAARARR